MRRWVLLWAMTCVGCAAGDEVGGVGGDAADDSSVEDAVDAHDAASSDTGAAIDSGSGSDADATLPDTGAIDTGAIDTGAIDTGSPDTGALDTGAADTGSADTFVADTFKADTFVADTAVADTSTWATTQHVHIYIDNTCTMVSTSPLSFDVPAGNTLKIAWHNHSVDYAADVWMSYGGGYLDLASGATWNETYEHCFINSTHVEYADVTPAGSPSACGKYRLNIQCHAH